MKYAFIKQHHGEFSLTSLCRVPGVSRSGYHHWRKRPVSPRVKQQADIDRVVRRCFDEQKERYGAPRLAVELAEQGHRRNVKSIAKSLKRQGLRAVAGRQFKPRTTDSAHRLPVYDNVPEQDFSTTQPNQKWVQDISYIATGEGWSYLAMVIDLYSRLVVGWALSPRIDAVLVCDALRHALARRGHPGGVIVHSDRGSQYCSHDYRELVQYYQRIGSMSAQGCCYDNACAESFFHSLKVEMLHRYHFDTAEQVRQAIFRYIEIDYNRKRRHSACGYLSPEQYEKRQTV